MNDGTEMFDFSSFHFPLVSNPPVTFLFISSGVGEAERCDAAQFAQWRCGGRCRCEKRCGERHHGKDEF